MSDADNVDPGYRIVCEVLRRLAPDELPDLDLVWQAYLERPSAPSNLADRDRLLGSGLGTQLLAWAPLVVTFIGAHVLGGAAVDEAKDWVRTGTRRIWRRVTPRLRRSSASAPRPIVLTPEQIIVVAGEARQTALRLNLPPEQAQLFADAVAGALSTVSADGGPSAVDPR